MTAPWMQTASGVAFDLLNPDPAKIRFAADVAPALARMPRFGGHVSTGPYSVAQHCVIGAEAILAERGRGDLAAHFLLHDAHEAYVGDMTRPVAAALAAVVEAQFAPEMKPRGVVERAIGNLKARLDRAILEAACLDPLSSEEDRLSVKDMDERMLETERRLLLSQCERHWGELGIRPVRLRGGLRPWPWHEAADRWLAMFRELCPRGAI